MADYRITQKQSAVRSYQDDWTERLQDYPSNVTIVSCSGAPSGGIVLSNVSGSGKTVNYRIDTSAADASEDVTLTFTATLSNGDTDPRELIVGVT